MKRILLLSTAFFLWTSESQSQTLVAGQFASGKPSILQTDALGYLYVNCAVGCNGGGGPIAVTGTFWPYTLGQQLAASSVPVVLTSIQVAALTPPTVPVNVAPVTATNPAVVVDLRPDSPGIIALGPATPANSVPTVPAGYTYTHITTATTTTAKSGAGVLHTVCVNALGTVASTITIDDATSATTPTIAVVNSLALLGCQTYDVAFAIGLTLVTTGTVAPDVTVSWR